VAHESVLSEYNADLKLDLTLVACYNSSKAKKETHCLLVWRSFVALKTAENKFCFVATNMTN